MTTQQLTHAGLRTVRNLLPLALCIGLGLVLLAQVAVFHWMTGGGQ